MLSVTILSLTVELETQLEVQGAPWPRRGLGQIELVFPNFLRWGLGHERAEGQS